MKINQLKEEAVAIETARKVLQQLYYHHASRAKGRDRQGPTIEYEEELRDKAKDAFDRIINVYY